MSAIVDARRFAKVNVAEVPPGCRGAACPFFLQCQGRCSTRETRIHPDGGVWIETRG